MDARPVKAHYCGLVWCRRLLAGSWQGEEHALEPWDKAVSSSRGSRKSRSCDRVTSRPRSQTETCFFIVFSFFHFSFICFQLRWHSWQTNRHREEEGATGGGGNSVLGWMYESQLEEGRKHSLDENITDAHGANRTFVSQSCGWKTNKLVVWMACRLVLEKTWT